MKLELTNAPGPSDLSLQKRYYHLRPKRSAGRREAQPWK